MNCIRAHRRSKRYRQELNRCLRHKKKKKKRWYKAALEHKTTGNRGDTERQKWDRKAKKKKKKKKDKKLKRKYEYLWYSSNKWSKREQSQYTNSLIFNGNFCRANEIIFKTWEAQKLLRQAQPFVLPEKGGKK